MKGGEFLLTVSIFICTFSELPVAHAFLPVISAVHIWLLLIKKKIISLKTKKVYIMNSAMTSEVFQGMYATEEFSPVTYWAHMTS